MEALHWLHNCIVAAHRLGLAVVMGLGVFLAAPVDAQTPELDELFERLKGADDAEAERIEQEIRNEWSKSGSPSMDLLLQRGRDAMDGGDFVAAIEHLTALTDHAPDFAEGWNALATAYYDAGELGPSIEDIGKALTLNPRHWGALSGLALIFEELGKPEQALEVYRAALSINPHLKDVAAAIDRLEAATAGQDL